MLDKFRTGEIGNHNWTVQWAVDIFQQFTRPLRFHPDHDAIWLEEIFNSPSFLQKLRIRSDIELRQDSLITAALPILAIGTQFHVSISRNRLLHPLRGN